MIQRKQTIYLLLAVIASGLMFLFPIADFIGAKDSIVLYVQKVVSLVPDNAYPNSLNFVLPMLAANIFVIIFSLVAIFLFKNRKRQMHIIRLNILVEVMLIAIFFLYYNGVLETQSGGVVSYKLGVFMPLVALVFLVLANRGVMQDERLIRSADRLR